jgi:fibronectin type 3 domain-containing protein
MSLSMVAVRATLALSLILVSIPVAAAPGAFELTGMPVCDSYRAAIYLKWTLSAGATSYEVIRDDGRHATVTQTNGLYGMYSDLYVVTSGPSHTYFVRASDGGSVATDSNSVTVAPPITSCAPLPEPFTITGLVFCDPGDPQRPMAPAEQVEWPRVLFATSFDVYKNGAYVSTFNSVGAFKYEYEWIGSAPDSNTFYVVARNAAGISISNTVELTLPDDICSTAPPAAVLSYTIECNPNLHRPSVSLNWSNVPGVMGWQLFRNGSLYALPGLLGYTDINVEAGQTYTYDVATTGISAPLSNTLSVTVLDSICAPGPLIVTPVVHCDGPSSAVTLVWTESTNALSYTVMRDSTTIASGLKVREYRDTGVSIGAAYTYRVIAVNGSQSTTTPPATITVDEVCPPGSFETSALAICRNDATAVQLVWTGSPHAASYMVFHDGSAISGMLSAAARDYIDTVPPGAYRYDVIATNVAGSLLSSASIFLPASACGSAPHAFTASASTLCGDGPPSVHLQWAAAEGASSYVVNRNGARLSGALSSQAFSYDDATTVAGQSYSYAVVASNAAGSSAAPLVTITPSSGDCPPGVFTLMASTACDPLVTLTWTLPPNNVLNYTIFRNEGAVATVSAVTMTYAEETASLPDGPYSFFVHASGAGGASDSNVIAVSIDRRFCDVPAPDLVALDVHPSVMNMHPGELVAVSFELANGGTATAQAMTARIRLGQGLTMSASDPLVSTMALPALTSGATLQRTMNVTLPAVAAGTYRLFISLDEEHVSGDVHFADNIKASDAITLIDMISPRRRAAGH